MKNIMIVTGASSGLGMEFALQVDPYFSNIDEIWLIARNKGRLKEVSKVMEHKTRIFSMDITKEAQIERLEDAMQDNKVVIRMLINCAGYGVMGKFEQLDCEEQLGMIQTNCKALTAITYACLPFMRRNSRIIQLASSAAFMPQQIGRASCRERV